MKKNELIKLKNWFNSLPIKEKKSILNEILLSINDIIDKYKKKEIK